MLRAPRQDHRPGACHTVGVRVAEIARLTGTTVRTVRYYHSLGLLPVPPERGGWRDYELAHVARLSRIRWLVQAGVPLAAVGRIIERTDPPGGPGGHPVRTAALAPTGPVQAGPAGARSLPAARAERLTAPAPHLLPEPRPVPRRPRTRWWRTWPGRWRPPRPTWPR